MSDLTATNCGCAGNCGGSNNGFGGSCIWILLLLFCCGNGNGCGNNCGCGNNNGILGGGGDCCDILIWILLISCFCGNGNNCGNNCGCGNSCGSTCC